MSGRRKATGGETATKKRTKKAAAAAVVEQQQEEVVVTETVLEPEVIEHTVIEPAVIETIGTVEQELLQDVNTAISTLNLNREIIIPDNVINKQSQKINEEQFYLYYILERQAAGTSQPDTASIQKKLLENMKKLDTEGINIIFVIIRMYSVKNKDSKMFDLPYRAKVLKEHTTGCYDLEFDLKDLPAKLQLMMHNFCLRHLENLQETQVRFVF